MQKDAKDTVCPTCGGTGRVQQSTRTILGSFTSVTTCPSCHGTGKNPKAFCKACQGVGAIEREKKITIKIPAGVSSGQSLRLKGLGLPSSDGYGVLNAKIKIVIPNNLNEEAKKLYEQLANLGS